jgi:hypothetical protein
VALLHPPGIAPCRSSIGLRKTSSGGDSGRTLRVATKAILGVTRAPVKRLRRHPPKWVGDYPGAGSLFGARGSPRSLQNGLAGSEIVAAERLAVAGWKLACSNALDRHVGHRPAEGGTTIARPLPESRKLLWCFAMEGPARFICWVLAANIERPSGDVLRVVNLPKTLLGRECQKPGGFSES